MDPTGSSHSNEGEGSQPVAVASQRENSCANIISPEGCSKSEAYKLLSDRMFSEPNGFCSISLSATSPIDYGSLAFTLIYFTSSDDWAKYNPKLVKGIIYMPLVEPLN